MAKKVTPRLKREPPVYFFRAWRRHRGLTQEQLAERVDMSVSSISQLETGKQGFSDDTLLALADALSCEPGDLLSRDPALEAQVAALLKLIEKKDAQASVMAFLNALPDKTGTDVG
ncbi:MAG: helix-turn-helix transcriptional regulator [Devosia sp.]|nr:helix-turn-helix transcriptional regulator [Devosia sp.]